MANKTKAAPKPSVTISVALRREIVKRAKRAFRNFDRNTGEIVARCHNVGQRTLDYRLPEDARSAAGQAVRVRREGKNIIVSKTVVSGVSPR